MADVEPLGARRGTRLGAVATGTIACAALVAGCTSTPATDRPSGTSSRTSAQVPSADVPRSDPPVVRPPATPAQRERASGQVDWRTYLGATVPGGDAGPRHVTARTASGWRHTRAGALLAAAHYSVALDARQPRGLWRSALRRATPKRRVKAELRRMTAAADDWDRRRLRDARSGHNDQSDTDVHRLPSSVWRPPVRVVGYSELEHHRKHKRVYSVVLWSRTSGQSTWRRRATSVKWSRGDWRLRLPVDRRWHQAVPTAEVEPISVVLS